MENEGNSPIFYNESMGEIDLETQFQILGMGAYILSLIVREDDDNSREKLFSLAADLFAGSECVYFWNLYDAIRIYDAWEKNIDRDNEYSLQSAFKKCADKVIEGSKVIKGPYDRHNIPDAWLEINGEKIPVEVKLSEFNQKAADQLNRYVSTFGSKYGVAVARELTCELPANYIFVSSAEVYAAIKPEKAEQAIG